MNGKNVLVLGMHRSGTSLVSEILHKLGFYFAPEGYATGKSAENPQGFWERRDIRIINDYFLRSHGLDWNKTSGLDNLEIEKQILDWSKVCARWTLDDMSLNGPWLLKEPRISILYPLWSSLLESIKIIFVYRDPVEVASSLNKRNGMPFDAALALWEYYNRRSYCYFERFDFIFVNYNELLKKPDKYVDRVARFVGFEDDLVSKIELAKEAINPLLYRNRAVSSELRREDGHYIDLYDRMCREETLERGMRETSLQVLKKYEKAIEIDTRNVIRPIKGSLYDGIVKYMVQSSSKIESLDTEVSGIEKQINVSLKEREERMMSTLKLKFEKDLGVAKNAIVSNLDVIDQAFREAVDSGFTESKRANDVLRSLLIRSISNSEANTKHQLEEIFANIGGHIESLQQSVKKAESDSGAAFRSLDEILDNILKEQRADLDQVKDSLQRIRAVEESLLQEKRKNEELAQERSLLKERFDKITAKQDLVESRLLLERSANAKLQNEVLRLRDELFASESAQRSLEGSISSLKISLDQFRGRWEYLIELSREYRNRLNKLRNSFALKFGRFLSGKHFDLFAKVKMRGVDLLDDRLDACSSGGFTNSNDANSQLSYSYKTSNLIDDVYPIRCSGIAVTIIIPTVNLHGGVKRLLKVANELHEQGHLVRVVQQYRSDELDWFDLKPTLEQIHFNENTTVEALESLLPDADILLTYGNNRAACVLNDLSSRKGIKYLLYMHFGIHDESLDVKNAKLSDFKYLCTTHWIKKNLQKFVPKITCISFGVHSDQFQKTSETALFTLGTLYHKDEWKGFSIVLEAVERVREKYPVTLVVFGQSKEVDLPNWVEYHYHPNQEKLKDLYSQCSLWIVGSNYEGLGMCAVEAMLCQTAVVTSDRGGGLEFCNENNSFLVGDRSVEGFEEVILDALSDERRLLEISQNGERDIRKFKWEIVTKNLTCSFVEELKSVNPNFSFGHEPLLTIGIPIKDQLGMCINCIQSVYRHTRVSFKLLLIDDESGAETREFLRDLASRYDNCDLIANSESKGFPSACNSIILGYNSPFICLLNSDTIVTENWDIDLIGPFYADSKVGMTGPSTSYGIAKDYENTAQQLDEVHVNRYSMGRTAIEEFSLRNRKERFGELKETEYLNGFCMMINRSLVRQIGFFDTMFGLGSREEVQFIDRLKMVGMKCVWVKFAYVHHFGHQSFSMLTDQGKGLWEKNKKLYFESKNAKKLVGTTSKKILFVYNSKYTNSTRKRTFEPVSVLKRYMNVESVHWPQLSKVPFEDYSAVVLQRIGALTENISAEFLDLVKTLKYTHGKKVFYDLDDYVVANENTVLSTLLGLADRVFCSTKYLCNVIERDGLDSVYIPNSVSTNGPSVRRSRFSFKYILFYSIAGAGYEEAKYLGRRLFKELGGVKVVFISTEPLQDSIGLKFVNGCSLDELWCYVDNCELLVNYNQHSDGYIENLKKQYGIADENITDFEESKSALKFFKASCCSKPTVSSRSPHEYIQAIENSKGGLLVESKEECFNQVRSLLLDDQKRMQMGENARNYVFKFHSPGTIATHYLKQFCQIDSEE